MGGGQRLFLNSENIAEKKNLQHIGFCNLMKHILHCFANGSVWLILAFK